MSCRSDFERDWGGTLERLSGYEDVRWDAQACPQPAHRFQRQAALAIEDFGDVGATADGELHILAGKSQRLHAEFDGGDGVGRVNGEVLCLIRVDERGKEVKFAGFRASWDGVDELPDAEDGGFVVRFSSDGPDLSSGTCHTSPSSNLHRTCGQWCFGCAILRSFVNSKDFEHGEKAYEENAMKVLSSWTIRPGQTKEAVRRFLAGQAAPVEGVTLLGRWHKTDGSGGWGLYETDNPSAMYEGAMKWAGELEFHSSLVIEDGEAGPVLAKVFGK